MSEGSAPTVGPVPSRIAQRLSRLGFAEPVAAERLLAGPRLGWWNVEANEPTSSGAAAAVAALGRAPDPDLALRALAAMADAQLRCALETSPSVRGRLTALLGTSVPLGEHLTRHPADWTALADDDPPGVPRRLATAVHAAPTGQAGPALRASYRRELVAIAGRDLAGELDLEVVSARLADLAGYTLQAALTLAEGDDPKTPAPLAVVAMGKAGGRELNYLSDVDVIFVAEDDDPAQLSQATRLAAEAMRICAAVAWEVDAALRPEGKAGPLVRTLASHEAYYRRWASTWEFQALLKARPVAGDLDLGRRYVETIAPLVWTAAERPGFVDDVQAMRRRVVANVRPELAAREIKLGPGGLRDVEFAVQLLQLVHGRSDESLRAPGTLAALHALRDGGYVGRDDAVSLDAAYRFLRAAEHRIQLRRLRRTHLVPDDPAELQVLARAMGFRPDARGDARAVWQSEWALHGREVRRLHEKLFYRPLLDAVAHVPSTDLRLSPDEARRRLVALGYADPAGALRHIDALTSGISRRAAIQRTLLPVMLGFFSDAPDPDAGLRAYRQVSDALGGTPWYLRLLRDEGAVAARLARVLGTSGYVAHMLVRAPEALRLLADDDALLPLSGAQLRTSFAEAAARQPDERAAVSIVRGLRRQELLRIAFADLLRAVDVPTVGLALSDVTDATLSAALDVACRSIATEQGAPLPVDLAVIAMGRLGGAEVGYGSDADVQFVYAARNPDVPEDEAARTAIAVVERLRRLLGAASADPPLSVDADLRPEGRNGPLARSLRSYERYYQRWSSAWEAQALLRARFCAGDEELARRFFAVVDPVRYPQAGLVSADEREIRRIKGRIDSERLPRGADPTTHVKLGRGGLADVEWTVQLLQLAHGHDVAALRTPRTLDAVAAAAKAGLLDGDDAQLLETAWRLATRARNAIMLVTDRPSDQLPTSGPVLVAVGRAMGYPAGFDPGRVVDDYRRAARRARKVVERVFYGSSPAGTLSMETRAGGASGAGTNAP